MTVANFISFKGIVTTYGYPGDSTRDENSAKGIGAWDNHLDSQSMAVSRDVEAAFLKAGIKPRSMVEITLVNGKTIQKR